MKHHVVISCNENKNYLFYAPIVTEQWRKMGCEVLLLLTESVMPDNPAVKYVRSFGGHVSWVKQLPELDTVTQAQLQRLVAATLSGVVSPNDLLTTSDIDMLTYFVPAPVEGSDVTTYGHDLTAFQHVPVCYVTAEAKIWCKILGIDLADVPHRALRKLTDRYPKTFSSDKLERWLSDQDILTDAVANAVKRTNVHRGQLENGLAIGRLDRSGWVKPEQMQDCHLPTDSMTDETMQRLIELGVNETFLRKYRNEFINYYAPVKAIYEPNEWNVLDDDGMVFPWYTAEAVEWLKTNLYHVVSILEIGGGNSTQWYRHKGFDVRTIETDYDCARKLGINTTENVLAAVCMAEPAHLVIVDGGEDRNTYIRAAFDKALNTLIVDNWQQEAVSVFDSETVNYLCKNSKQLLIFNQPGHPDWKTAVFIK